MRIALLSHRSRRGNILITTFFICMLAALSSTWMFGTLLEHQKQNKRRRDLARAYFAAIAGVAQVQQYGNKPDDYTPNPNFFRRDADGNYPYLVLGGEKVLSGTALVAFASKYAAPVSHIKSITLIPKDTAADPVPCLFKVRSIGQSGGVQRAVMAYLGSSPLATAEIMLPAGLISLGSAGQSGNGTVHWGESWSKNDFEMLNKSQCGHLAQGAQKDPWAVIRTEKKIIYPSTWKVGNGKDIYDPSSNVANYDPGKAPASGTYAGSFAENVPPGTLQWPDFLSKYADFKSMGINYGRYYGTDAAGNVYRDGIKDSAHKVDFNAEFGEANRELSPYDFVFIDTINGQPPAADGSNLATIQNSGTGIGMKGIFWVGANYKQTGAGNPASLTCEKPDLTTQSIGKVYLDGVFYSAGLIDMGGNPIVYGSVVAQKGYASGGTPEIYYNHKLKDGLEFPKANVPSFFTLALEKNFGVPQD